MTSIIILSFIIAQTAITIYLFNALHLKDSFEKILNAFLIILFFHLGTKLFILAVLQDSFLYNNNVTGFGLSYGPLIYFTARIYVNKPVSRKGMLVHMSPFLLFTGFYLLNSVGYLFGLISHDFVVFYSMPYQWLVIASLLVYPVLSANLLNDYRRLEHILTDAKLRLLNGITAIMIIGTTLGLCIACIRYAHTGHHTFDIRLVPYMCFIVIPALILRYKMQPVIIYTTIETEPTEEEITINMEEEPIEKEKRYKKSTLSDEMMDRYETILKKFMDKSKIYLDTELSLEDLASRSAIPKHHLTQLLNERFRKNFYVFINEYRIEEAIKKLSTTDDDNVSMLSLAYDCGFNSKSSFNNYFKKVTGHTPSGFRKEHAMQPVEK
ncbi:MAG: helix-turn-helix domain-containing protein [Agriterribacter sp.]